ncbi:MAG: hypothetical protein ACLPYS_04285 [Vulcanimicrobiaceae bacterium]
MRRSRAALVFDQVAVQEARAKKVQRADPVPTSNERIATLAIRAKRAGW